MLAFISSLPLRNSELCISKLQWKSPTNRRIRTVNTTRRARIVISATANSFPSDRSAGLVRNVSPSSQVSVPDVYKTVRLRIFLTMLLAYATYYITRFSFPFAAPIMQEKLNLSLQQVGLISSCFPATYGISKLFGGMAADLRSPRIMLSVGLLLAALCNAMFAAGNSVTFFAVLWALNGLVSSVGFPACAKLLSVWFSRSERGTYWGLLNVSLNVGGAISPVIVGVTAARYGWQFGMLLPAVMAFAMAGLSFTAISDSPQAAKLPPTPLLPPPQSAEKKSSAWGTFLQQLREGVIQERSVWLLAAAYFFVYIVRQALTSWTIFYLMKARGVVSLAEAGLRVSGLEVGGLLGSVTSGWLSDLLIQKNGSAGAIGQRIRVVLLYVALTALCVTAFFATPATNAFMPLQWILFALTGVGLYGQQLLVGLCSTECVDRRFAGTSNGFVGLSAYAGAALAGFPLSLCVKEFGWGALQGIVIGCSMMVALLVLPLLRKRSHEQKAALVNVNN
ncbi:UhpC Sugar phosphate permease regulatory protein (IC) [Gracilaria domingensis]|nr:UhpC Sugar phosphate permease regulatory protein (IC) [Gracilaria domingensis]